ncbi:MAG TPA: site-2 protease family protein [Dehalococcoidia bacterium]|jgi:Zn-dependent protease|nr:site-2 protease family protein [Dehalococcoidia bacterium]
MILYRVLNLFEVDPFAALIFFTALVTALLLGISFHEFSHAYIADSLGDGLPRRMGRVTLNPLAHLEPIGTILMFTVGIGWGRPVPVNPYNTRNPKASLGITAAAGPISNFVVAGLAGLPLKLDLVPWISPLFSGCNFDPNCPLVVDNAIRSSPAAGGFTTEELLGVYLTAIVLFSLMLGIFNLIPIAPLDGFKVAVGFLPSALSESFSRLEQYGPILLITLLALPFLTGTFVLLIVMEPIIKMLAWLFAGVPGEDVFV